MAKESFRYQPLHEVEVQEIWEKHKYIIENFIRNNKYNPQNIDINVEQIMAIISKVDQRKRYFKYFHGLDMSEYKEVALICFWYIKLRPISICCKEITPQELKSYESINEKLAVYLLLSTFRAILNDKKLATQQLDRLPKKYISELIYFFTYRDISKEAMILLVESMAVFLGIDPYKNVDSRK